MSCSSSESTTPIPTATGIDSSSVATKVATSAIWEAAPVRQIVRIWAGWIAATEARIRTAASVAIATLPTIPANTSRITSIQIPLRIEAQRLRAPTETESAVCPTDAPTGIPPITPEQRLPMPWPTKSPSTLDGTPSGLGDDSRTPAPWTSTIAAIESAPVTIGSVSRPRSGIPGVGSPLGIEPESETSTTPSLPSRIRTSVGSASASTAENVASRVRPTISRTASAPTPTASVAGSIRPGWTTMSSALASGNGPEAEAPSRSGSWPSRMLSATPVRKPVITECETKRV